MPAVKTEVGTIEREEPLFENKFVKFIRRYISTLEGLRDQIIWDRRGKSFAIAVALTPEGHFVLVEEPKFGQMRRMVTCAAGGINAEETPEAGAEREFREETGYTAEHWQVIRTRPLVDTPDKAAGGDHFFVLGRNAKKVGEPEAGCKVLIRTRKEVEMMLDGHFEGRSIDIAMSVAAIEMVLRVHGCRLN